MRYSLVLRADDDFPDIQKTLKKSTSITGVGLFTGEKVEVVLLPAPEDTGIVFQREDLPLKPKLPACLSFVKETPRCTRLGSNGTSVQTVEHLLSALSAYQIDNLLIQINGPELPACDGSARAFVELIEEAGIQFQNKKRNCFVLEKPVYWSYQQTHLIALPSSEYRISYTMHYPHSLFLKSQYYSFCVNWNAYKQEIAPSRTFSLYEEIEPMLKSGLLKGGGLDNGVVIKGNVVMNPDGVRFHDEMVRHKILDLVGDLSLIGIPFRAHIIAIRSGHFSNVAFARELKNYILEGKN